MSEKKHFIDENLSLAYYGLMKTIDELRIAKLNARQPELREYIEQQIQHLSEIRRGMGRRSMTNQQRKGQFLWNKISMSFKARNHEENYQQVEHILWNMSNKEFDEIMKEYETDTQESQS